MPRLTVPRATAIRASAIVLLLALAAHGPSVRRNGFVSFDDGRYVYENAAVRQGLSRESIRWAFQVENEIRTYFHPLTWLSLMADHDVFGLRPWGFHAVNVALHAAAAILLLWILLVATGEVAASTIAAAAFAVHPLTVEAVAWVAERKTVLSSALGFAAILTYVTARGKPTWRRVAAVSALHLASLLAKPGLVVLPVLLLVLDAWPLKRLAGGSAAERRDAALRLVLEKVPMALVSLAIFALVASSTPSVGELHTVRRPLTLTMENAIASIPAYLLDVFWPTNLSAFHPFPVTVAAGAVVVGLLTLAAATGAAAAFARRVPAAAAGWAWFCVALLPYLGFKYAGLWPGRADRFAYVPMAGIAVALAFTGARLLPKRSRASHAGLAVAAAAIAALGSATVAQGRHWKDSVALYARAVDVEPNSAAMRSNLGWELARAGRPSEAGVQAEKAIRLDPKLTQPRVLLAGIRALEGRLTEAEAQYRETLLLDPADWEATMLLAELLRREGRYVEARPLYARVLEIVPRDQVAVREHASSFAR